MKLKIIKKLTGLCLCLIIAAGITPAQQPAASDETALRQVIESFRRSLINKNKPLFLGLFLEGRISWQPVTEDASLVRIKDKNPSAAKTVINPEDNYLTFIDWITTDKKLTEETFSDIKIQTDGDIAFIGFKYTFSYDRRETNHGQEYWLLVRTENGWKINSVVWSETLPFKS